MEGYESENTNDSHMICVFCLVVDTTNVADFLKEALTMSNFDHSHVLKLVGVSFFKWVPLIVTPFMEKGDLRKYLLDSANVLELNNERESIRKCALSARYHSPPSSV